MSLSRLGLVARLDVAHNLRRPLFWILVLLLAFMAWGMSAGFVGIQTGDSSVGGKKALLTSEFALAQTLGAIVFLFYSFFIAVAAGMAIIRDDEAKVGELLHATALTPREYVWGKWTAVAASFLAILALHIALLALLYHVVPNADMLETRGPFHLASYLRPALAFSIPTLTFLGGTAFYIGEQTRKPILVFVLPVALLLLCGFFLWSWSPSWLDPRVNYALTLLDPGAYRWLTETYYKVDRGADFYNTARVDYFRGPLVAGFDAGFVASRFAFFAIGLGCIALARRHFERTLRGAGVSTRAAARARAALVAREGDEAALAGAAPATPLASLGMRSAAPGSLAATLAVARAELRELRAQPGLYLFIPLILLQTLGDTLSRTGAFDAPLLLTAGALAVGQMDYLTALLTLLLMFYAVESAERERSTGFASIHNTLPVRTASLLAGKTLALSFVAAVSMVACLVASDVALIAQHKVVPASVLGLAGAGIALAAGGIALFAKRHRGRGFGVLAVAIILACFALSVVGAAAQGKSALDLTPFALVWGLLLVPTFAAWTAFVLALYSITKSRYTTYALAIAVLGFTLYRLIAGKMNWVGNWPLWGSVRWSDMGPLEFDRTALVLNRLFVIGLAIFFWRLAVRHFPRRERDAIRVMHGFQPARLWRNAFRAVPALLLPLVAGAALWNQVSRGPDGPRAKKIATDYWRRNLATWREAPTPALARVDMDLAIEPAERRWRVNGSYLLVNRQSAPLRQIPLTVGLGWRNVVWTMNGVRYAPDTASHLYVFTPPRPLAPGEWLRIGFRYEGREEGASENGGGAGEFILPSGVVMTSFSPRYFPSVGYEEEIGVEARNRYEPRRYADDFYEGVTPPAFGSQLPMTTRIRISVPAEYTANSVGSREGERVAGGRRVVTWVSDQPVMAFNVVAARYRVRRGMGTALYYHPEHEYNAAEMTAALDGARKYYSEWFGAFPWNELKVSEFPALASYAQGFPTNISFAEAIGFLTKSDPRTNTATMVTAHESAHQWWGNMLQPGRGPGGNILSEGMAHFSTALLLEQIKGARAGLEFRTRIEDSYGDSRRADAERPLVQVDGSKDGDQTVTYDKGGWVFWMLTQRMGRERALAGMRSFIAAYRGNADHPVLQDFSAHLRPFAPDPASYDDFVRQWFHEVVLPEYRLTDAKRAGPGGAWETTVRVRNVGTGRMPVEVAVVRGERFPKPEDEGAGGAAKSSTKSPAKSLAKLPTRYEVAKQEVLLGAKEEKLVTLRSLFRPDSVVVDPDVRVLQLRRKLARVKL